MSVLVHVSEKQSFSGFRPLRPPRRQTAWVCGSSWEGAMKCRGFPINRLGNLLGRVTDRGVGRVPTGTASERHSSGETNLFWNLPNLIVQLVLSLIGFKRNVHGNDLDGSKGSSRSGSLNGISVQSDSAIQMATRRQVITVTATVAMRILTGIQPAFKRVPTAAAAIMMAVPQGMICRSVIP